MEGLHISNYQTKFRAIPQFLLSYDNWKNDDENYEKVSLYLKCNFLVI